MKNLTKLLISCLLITSFAVHAKESPNEAGLKTSLENYKLLQLDGNLKETLDYTYPAIFKVMPKESMLAALEQALNSGMSPKITILEQKPESIQKFSKGVFAKVPYSMEMSMNMFPSNIDKEKKEKMEAMTKDPKKLEQFSEFMTKMLKSSLGDDAEVKLNKETLRYEIKKSGLYIAINENDTGWKFIDTTPNPMINLEQILPKEISESIK